LARKRSHPPVLKRFGQHFLNDQSALEDIADSAGASSSDVVIEIGPGRGSLTELLLARAGRVIVIEIDHMLAERLRERYASNHRITVVESDVLAVRFAELVNEPFIVVGNVPYYITTPILFHTLQPPLPKRCVFLVQREVAERIVATPGSRDYGALTVNVQAVARAEIVRGVPPGAFTPPPKVDSAVIRLTPLDSPLIPVEELDEFRSFVLSVFGMRRKQIANVLRSVRRVSLERANEILVSEGIDPAARPETLSALELAALMRNTRLSD
jgi:16S rRNA (adenine1518-N6/adenine1519-N6)-dimethyltransferase